MGPEDLAEIMSKLEVDDSPELLVGLEHSDDAGVIYVSEDLALVQTLDFITPLVGDPFRFGRIAAVNSLSDVYAMGGRPMTALNICSFPAKSMPKSELAEILKGGYEAIRESGAMLLGGHTIKDEELKYGLSVTGRVHPHRVLPNSTARPGDKLILTKALGTALVFAGFGRGEICESDVEPAILGMMMLNRAAAECLDPYVESLADRAEADAKRGVHALTDVTGFGLAGHALEVARASGVSIEIFGSSLLEYPHARDMADRDYLCGGSRSNRKAVEAEADFSGARESDIWLTCDAQTSGGLLISVAEADADALLADLTAAGVADAAVVGRVLEEGSKRIRMSR
jgi:selenide, water dikinase